jgi:hypothetical protein
MSIVEVKVDHHSPTESMTDSGTEEFFGQLRKALTSYLAQRLTLSLFVIGKEAELRAAITRLVESKLAQDAVVLRAADQHRLIDELIAGLPKHNTLPAVPVKSAPSSWTVDTLRTHIAPYIAEHLGNHLFEPGREAQLSEALYMLVQEKIRIGGLDISEDLKRSVIEAICRGMSIPLPSALNPAALPPVKSPTPSPKSSLDKSSGSSEEPKSDTRKLDIEAVPPPWQDLTPDFRRQILLHMGSRLKTEILSSGQTDAVQIHIAELLGHSVQEFRVRLTEDEREEIINTILSGDGLEFQL